MRNFWKKLKIRFIETLSNTRAELKLNKDDDANEYVINGVRYIVPQRVDIKNEEGVKLYFRVGQVYKGAKVVVECDGNILSSKKKVMLAPGEMENVTITPEMLKNMNENSEITVRIEE